MFAFESIRRSWPVLLVGILSLLPCAVVVATPPVGPSLDASYLRPPAEPPGPSSRRAGIVVSEIMYHPAARLDGRDLRFVEIFNSQAWFEELGGWQLKGDIDFTFPTDFTLPARSYVVVAANPADLMASSSATGVLGPYTGSLSHGTGTVQLKNRLGAVQFEVVYRDSGPWPVAPDGAGPSLVLSRPSYGEADPRAWAASEVAGGSPGAAEPAAGGMRTVWINEVSANPVPPALDFVELFNYSGEPADISGCVLTDNPSVARHVFPAGTVIAPNSWLMVDSSELGFGLSSGGEALFLGSADGTRVLDAVRFGPQGRGVSYGRVPDGSPRFDRLATPTPGTANAGRMGSSVVLNELMYDPASGDSSDEYVELYNVGTTPVDLGDWRLEDAVGFTFPEGTRLAGGGYLVVAKAAAHLRTNYPGLGPGNLLGDYSGGLGNSGDRVALSAPELVVSTNKSGHAVTNRIHVVVDEVTYASGGRWGKWSGGGGSSLELRDARADRRLAPNWADSDESGKSGWVTVAATGVSTLGLQTANALELFLYGPGECLVDNVEVVPNGSTNLVANSNFETGTTGWVFQGNHGASSLDAGEGYESSQSLHVRATGAGHTGPNRIRVPLLRVVTANQTVTLRAKVRWLKGTGSIHLRLHGNWFEAPGFVLAAHDLGTPGARNSRAVANAGPAITGVSHFPVLPAPLQGVVVTARADDPDGIANLVLRWRKDPSASVTEVPMTNNGAGLYTALIPGQASTSLVAFHVVATDGAAVPATSAFPSDAPARECLIRWGELLPGGVLGTYRMWMTKTNVDRWTKREKLSNDPLDGTFVYGNFRAIYNAGGMYSGSPYHAPSWTGPAGADCDYVFAAPDDDAMLGGSEMNLLKPGNGGGDGTLQAEQQAYWIADQLGLPHCNRRPVLLYFNGVRRGATYDDAQQPNGDFVRQWYPDDAGGELHKIQLWFEFDPSGSSFDGAGADLSNYLVGGAKRVSRYRWNWPQRSFGNNPNNFTNLFRLVDAVNTTGTGDAYTRTLLNATDVDEWFRTDITEHLVGNNDSYSYGGGQNMYAYKPVHGPWQLLIWDIDFAFASLDARSDMFSIGGQNVGPVNTHPPFARLYYQGLQDAVSGPLQTNRYVPILDARYNGMRTNGATGVGSPNTIKTYMNTRRVYLTSLLTNKLYGFAFTSNGGASFSSAGNSVTLAGVAPIAARTVLLNGVPLDVRWTTLSNWTATVALSTGTNVLELSGLDSRGQQVTNAPAHIKVRVTDPTDAPEISLVISEVMHHPTVPGAGFVEIRNRSIATAFDLTGWRLDGVGTRFAPGTTIGPSANGVVVEDPVVFAQVYGPLIKPIGVFAAKLNPGGGSLRLVRPDPVLGTDLVVDQFAYEADAPWPSAALAGSSLQLLDLGQDNIRPANWTAVRTDGTDPAPSWQRIVLSGFSSGTGLQFYMSSPGEAYIDDVRLVAGGNADSGDNLISDGGFETATDGLWIPGASLSQSAVSRSVSYTAYASFHIVSPTPGTGSPETSFVQNFPAALDPGTQYTLSFRYLPATGGMLVARTSDGGIQASVALGPVSPGALPRSTPGTANSVATSLTPFPALWLNELQSQNVTGPTDNAGEHEPWVELYNSRATVASLAGCYLTDSFDSARKWEFPAGTTVPAHGYLLVWLDGQPQQSVAGQPHAGFRPLSAGGLLALASIADGRTNVLDYVRYVPPGPDRSLGLYPDATPGGRRIFATATPRAANSLAAPLLPVFVNEWMADNSATARDPVGGGFDDWFELYNAGDTAADLAGYYLANSLVSRLQFSIPAGYIIPPRGRLMVWADKKSASNAPTDPDLHVNFKLSASGESIVLSSPDGTIVDAVTFGAQSTDVSEGRVPDGGVVAGALPSPSPGNANPIPPPSFLGIGTEAGAARVSWTTFPGVRYQLEATPDLEFPAWLPVGDTTDAHGPAVTVRDDIGDAASRFYRVRLVP